jgi:2-C-methyl-D-erythritol 2,4-cyclodiphosphate synthase
LSTESNRLAIVRVGIGTDLHRLAEGRRLVLGHVTVEHTHGPVAHSDGDVVLHAMIDALVGAAGLPDIGEMFPDTDPRWRGADSGLLLTATLAKVAERGYQVVNVDATIHAQRPKLGPHKAAIRAEVARLLAIPVEAVSIKAKTGEGVDAVGREEAIACTAVAGLGIRTGE